MNTSWQIRVLAAVYPLLAHTFSVRLLRSFEETAVSFSVQRQDVSRHSIEKVTVVTDDDTTAG
jgi:hypothetical protein